MPSGYKSNGVDLDNIFVPYSTGPRALPVGFNTGGLDLNQRYAPLVQTTASATGYKTNSVDLNQIFEGQSGWRLYKAAKVRGIDSDFSGNNGAFPPWLYRMLPNNNDSLVDFYSVASPGVFFPSLDAFWVACNAPVASQEIVAGAWGSGSSADIKVGVATVSASAYLAALPSGQGGIVQQTAALRLNGLYPGTNQCVAVPLVSGFSGGWFVNGTNVNAATTSGVTDFTASPTVSFGLGRGFVLIEKVGP